MRRYDIDWLRVIAIGLLLIYHVAIGFQPWGMMIGFITNKNSWTSLWVPMSALNVWRIPLLFFVSGMGVYFAMQQRTGTELLKERALRIALPFVAGVFMIAPMHILIWQMYYAMDIRYDYSPGHLWFLGNIFCYVLLLSPLLYVLKRNEDGKPAQVVKFIFSHPIGLAVVVACFIAEALVIKPFPYELYALTWHGFAVGLLAFFFGFCFVFSGQAFWQMIQKWRWVFLLIAIVGFTARQFYFGMTHPIYLLVSESQAWIMAVLAFGSKYLNHPGKLLSYFSQAAYPVYILHMIFLYLASLILFPMSIPVPLQFVLVLIITLAGCLGSYEVIRRVRWLRPFFGLK